ncbi:MAG: PDZ domain-containing protein [Bdellovibrionales bacterium]
MRASKSIILISICLLPFSQAKESAPKLSQLPLILVGTIIRAESDKSLGTIKFKSTGVSEAYHVNDKISTMAKVTGFVREKILFTNLKNGESEYLRIPAYDSKHAASAAAIDDRSSDRKELQVSRKTVDEKMKDIFKILQEAASKPYVDSTGQIRGFEITWIKPGSIWESLGIRAGDKLNSINGKPCTSAQDALELLNQLRDSSMIEVKLGRGDREVNITYVVR